MSRNRTTMVLKPRDPNFTILASKKGGVMTSPARKKRRHEQRELMQQLSAIQGKHDEYY